MAKTVAIVDYGLGNLFSIQAACRYAGLEPKVSSEATVIEACDGLILPGVGAFADAMGNLKRLDLVSPILDFAQSGRPLMGICLGIQLLLSESTEFGDHPGLGLIPGRAVSLKTLTQCELKVPQVGWNRLEAATVPWDQSLLNGIQPEDDYFYFVHSFVPRLETDNVVVAYTQYGDVRFCSAIQSENIFACQFHPERSGKVGLSIYRNLALKLSEEN